MMNSPSPIPSKNNVDDFIGSFVSLITKENRQYDGILQAINLEESTLCIKNVKINPPLSNEFSTDQLVFRGSDIKDLKIITLPEKSMIGHFVSLITTEKVRIEGTLTHHSVEDDIIIIKNAHCFGSEGRRKERSKIQPCQQLTSPIRFRFRNIEELEAIYLPDPQVEDCQSAFPAITLTHMQHRMGGL